jgi:phosphopantothenoylcysteine synthetase/decarboxylase
MPGNGGNASAGVCARTGFDAVPGLEKRPGHPALARWSDALVVLPASADPIGGRANGIAPDLLTTTIVAPTRPVVFCPNCPNLNNVMRSKAAVQRNGQTLREDGHQIMPPELATSTRSSREGWAELGLPAPEKLAERHGIS